MKLFGKKKETKSCCCGGNCTSETMQNAENKKKEKGIKILGSGCAKCMEVEKECIYDKVSGKIEGDIPPLRMDKSETIVRFVLQDSSSHNLTPEILPIIRICVCLYRNRV